MSELTDPVSVSGPDIETLLALALHDALRCNCDSGEVHYEQAAEVAVVLRAHIVTAQADAWDDGYETGYDDAIFERHGLSTDPDAGEFPHANPYRISLVGQIGADHD